MKTSELIGPALDWAVAKCEVGDAAEQAGDWWKPSTNWSQGGPIIERERMLLSYWEDHVPRPNPECWYAQAYRPSASCVDDYYRPSPSDMIGATPLIAAMRCYVASKLGDNIDIPKELL